MQVECLSIEKIDDVRNMPVYRYTFASQAVPKLVVIKSSPAEYVVGKMYQLEIY